MDKAEFLTIFPTFERLEIVRKTLPSIIAETKGNNARLIVHDSSVNGQAEKWAYLQELNQNNDFFLILSDNLSMAHVRNMCLSLGQELYAPDYICMVEDDHGYNSGFIISAIQAMKQYYGLPSPVGDLKYGLFTGCRVHNRHLTQKLPDGNAYVDPNSPPEQMGRANSCCRCAPTSHWNNVLKGLDTDEYLISYYQTKHLNLRNYHKGFTTLLVESGEKMFELESEGRGDSIKSRIRMWDDNYAASDSRSVFLGKPETYKSEPWKCINSRIQLEISSDDSQEYRRLGDSLFKEGKFEDAAAYYQRAIALDDKSVWAYFGLGKSYQRSGRLPDAITTYKKAIEYNSSKPDIYHWLGEALVLAGKAKEATITYQKAINLNPNLAYPYRGLGGAMMELGCLEGAIANFKKSIELNPKYVLAYNHLAKALLAQGNLEEGISVYKKLLYFNPQGFSEYKNLANLCNLLVIKGQLNRAISCYKDAIKANPNNSEVAAKEIERLERLKNYNKQVNAAYAQIIELNGNPATVDSNFKWNGKKFLYLVQTDATPPPHYEDIPCEDADILYLSYKEEIEGYIYFPNSTWTQGRNKLLESAKQLKHRYLYYIFLDDDIEFVRGDWREFEALLLKYMPAIATPRMGNFDGDNRLVSEHNKIVDSQLEAQVVYSYDAMFNSFHRDVVFDGLVLPYIDKFDDVSWWHSQLISCHISQMLYPNHVLQFNHLMVKNELHRPYPRKANFAEVEKWLLSTIFNNNDVVKTIFLPHHYYSQYRVPEKPVKPLKSYRSSDNLKKLVLKSKSGFYNFHLYQHKEKAEGLI